MKGRLKQPNPVSVLPKQIILSPLYPLGYHHTVADDVHQIQSESSHASVGVSAYGRTAWYGGAETLVVTVRVENFGAV